MMHDVLLEQAVFGGPDAGGYPCLARSPGFREDWLPLAEQLCAGFGERPAGIACPSSIFARPLGKHHVAVVQVSDREAGAMGQPNGLRFHLLLIPAPAYQAFTGDPFVLADRFPPPWQARGQLPTLALPAELPPPRTVAEVQRVLQRPDGPTLLGGVQALVDGGRLVFERPSPDPALVRGLWTLLPISTRFDLWPATFAFGNALGFDLLVVPRAGGDYAGYVNEEQAENYPEGRYELNLQIAAEAGDQPELNHLFARRSRAQTWRLGLGILGLVVVLALALQLLVSPAREPNQAPNSSPQKTATEKPATPKVGSER